MLRLAAFTLLFPSLALAQFGSPLTLSYPGNTEALTFSPRDCSGQTTVTWNYTGITQQCGPLKMWVTSGSCGTAAAATDYDLGSSTLPATGAGSGNEIVEFSKLPGFDVPVDGGVACGDATSRSWKICATYKGNQATGLTICGNTQEVPADLTLGYDGVPPDEPVITEALGADEAIRVRVEVDDEATLVRFAVRPEGDLSDFQFGNDAAADTTSVERRIDGLVNGQTYEISAIAFDAAGNQSANATIVKGTPVRTAGFFERYKDAGGTETGGCSAAPGLLGALAFAALIISRRRKS